MSPGHDLNVYISKMGDHMQGIATQFSPDQTPKGIAEYLEVMLKINSFNQLGCSHIALSPQFPMFPNICVCLPDQADLQLHRTRMLENTLSERELGMMAVRHPNILDWQTQENIGVAVSEHDLFTLSAIASMTEAIQQISQHKNEIAGASLVGISALGEQTADYILEGAQSTYKAMLSAQDKLLTYLKAPHGAKTLAKKAYYEAHHAVKEKVAEYIKRYGENRVGYLRKISFISNREQWLAKARIGISNFDIVDTEEFKSITEVMKTSKIIRGGCLALPIASLDVPEIYHLYKTGGDWTKEMMADGAGLIGGVMAGGLAVAGLEVAASVLALTPAGWIIILVGATASIAGELMAKDYIENQIDSWRKNEFFDISI